MDVKKIFGEVNTPPELRTLVLDTFPVSFWEQPRNVLEPCCGNGGFIMDIVSRFEKHLKPSRSRQWILENCLYWGDINPDNVSLVTELLQRETTCKYNKFVGDSLIDLPKTWPIFEGNFRERYTRFHK